MERIPLIIQSFLSYKETIQGRSQLTVKEYYTDLRTFFRFLIVSRGEVSISISDRDAIAALPIDRVDRAFAASVTTDEVYAFLLWLARDMGNGPTARARKLSALRSFYKYHTTKSHQLTSDPTRDIDSPKVRQALPKHLSLEESRDLLGSVDPDSDTAKRDYCMITFFLNCGMRLSELVGINLSDIDSDMRKMVVTGKGNKQRAVYLNKACVSALVQYLEIREKLGRTQSTTIKDKNALFLSSRGNRISNKTVQWVIKKQLKLAGLDGKGYSTHKLRHTAATLMYNNGNVDIRVLKDILGHEQLTTTQIYTHVSDKKLEEAMNANPLADEEQLY
ncbi:MAG: tyrosine recombinase XerC [Clostridia bacterium]|nr:tyrosine recombinase XerC [Clostridia bacterium]